MGARLGASLGLPWTEGPKMPKRVPPLTQLQIKIARAEKGAKIGGIRRRS